MRRAALIAVTAALPFAGWAAVLYLPEGPSWAGFPARLTYGPPLCAFVVLALARAGPRWGPLTVPAVAWMAGCLIAWTPSTVWLEVGWLPPLWVVPALMLGSAAGWWSVMWRRLRPAPPDPQPEPDDPAPAWRPPVRARPQAVDGVDVGWVDDPTPTPSLPVVRLVSPVDRYAGLWLGDEPDEAPEPDAPILDRLTAAWPRKPGGDPLRNVHLADLARILDMPEAALAEALAEAGVEPRKVTATRLEPDPETGRKGPATGKKGLTWDALSDAACATSRAMP